MRNKTWTKKQKLCSFEKVVTNTRIIYSLVKRRMKRRIWRIKNKFLIKLLWFIKHDLLKKETLQCFSLLNHIPDILIKEDNVSLHIIPTKEKVKNIVFNLGGDSASDPDGFTCLFINITNTYPVLLPKKATPYTFSGLRIKRLRNFINYVCPKGCMRDWKW